MEAKSELIYSKFTLPFHSKKHGYYIYCAETNSFARINKKIYTSVQEDNIDELDKTEKQLLKRLKVITTEKDQSDYFYKQRFQYQLAAFDNSSLGLAIAPTTACNFDCYYCYEPKEHFKTMSSETVDDLLLFIDKYNRINRLRITWYGGEPLAAFSIIQSITESVLRRKGLDFSHSMVSNGYLLNSDVSRFFVQHPLSDIQITLDGTQKNHDKVRNPGKGKSSFNKILNNVEGFIKDNPETLVSFRVNLDKRNEDDYPELYQSLYRRFDGAKVFVYPDFVERYTNRVKHCNVFDKSAKWAFYEKLHKKYKLPIAAYPDIKVGGCGANNINYFIVGPEGSLYKCWNDIGNPDRVIGHITTDKIMNPDVFSLYMAGPSIMDDARCHRCLMFPVCDGGCTWKRIENKFNSKNYELCNTRKGKLRQFLEMHLESAISKEKAST